MRIHKEHALEFFRFCCVGGVGFLIDYALLELFVRHGLRPAIARALSIALTMQVMYLLHGRITYRNHTQRGLKPWMRFLTTNALSMCINYGLFLGVLWLSPSTLPSLNRLIAIVTGTGTALFFNYFMNRRFAFKPHQDLP